ncbi:uncharacterized protein Z518_10061 [Rhinocladiella mackenziei CBS 650.93]|uniref:Rhinocladiella mackenziei CBS 650.93 unplaced genomic scaffold supercont1.8, whole genome shotgun sequence n=1 Tax=Rhinocladiella mackenziei CBS 650.93 TaxID=1442369 RepID=A0A0D2IWJ8_9EURO|nr:uncharacterized protein Z518_10061 [Rhinocladiella mackenziei CBS 650.93]KIX00995.1 hypothetical protein Z518_10061 [Rhinocladiella mackenziei CBS 650.93]
MSGSSSRATKVKRRSVYKSSLISSARFYIERGSQSVEAKETENQTNGTSREGKDKDLDADIDIEAGILAELDSLRPQSSTTNGASTSSSSSFSQKLSLVILDIPCVSFVRFPSNPTIPLDPVETVRNICLSASQRDSSGPRSRYIKRLTPVSLIRKTLSNGLEVLCDKVLPPHFLVDAETDTTISDSNSSAPTSGPESADQQGEASSKPKGFSYKFAIRPTIRSHNQLDRDQIIRVVADRITSLGRGKHRVDLKRYEKLVLVDVFKNVVGMSVVGSEFEVLKRFNLAEIYASHFEK